MTPDYNYNDQYLRPSGPQDIAATVTSTMKKVYVKMTLGLIVTGLVAWFCANSLGYRHFLAVNSWFMWVLIFGEFGLVIAINGAINRLSSGVASLLFYAFAVVNGLMFSTIFLAYSTTAIAKTFFITAGTFGAMSIYGYCTRSDLSRFGSFLFMALIGLIIACVVNVFLRSSGLDWVISIAGVFIFVGLTAWDTQQVKQMAMLTPAEYRSKLATVGALTLYLDFINLFLFLLRFFGGNRD